jgi:ATP-dependent protease Clp ATPase subunit
MSTPGDYPRAYICDECVAICQSILEEEKAGPELTQNGPAVSENHSLLKHPLASSLMQAIENWVCEESMGKDWVAAFGDVRRLAIQMINGPTNRHHT